MTLWREERLLIEAPLGRTITKSWARLFCAWPDVQNLPFAYAFFARVEQMMRWNVVLWSVSLFPVHMHVHHWNHFCVWSVGEKFTNAFWIVVVVLCSSCKVSILLIGIISPVPEGKVISDKPSKELIPSYVGLSILVHKDGRIYTQFLEVDGRLPLFKR